jgi:hypothetical protein
MERKLAIILKENERLNTLLSNQGSLSGADAQKITALEGKLFCTTSELEKLNKLLNDKHLENESLIKKLGESESKAKRIIELENSLLLLTSENQKLNKVVISNHETIESLNRSCDDLERKLQEKIWAENNNAANKRLGNISEDLERRLDYLAMENEKINEMLVEKIRELEEAKSLCVQGKTELDRAFEIINQQKKERDDMLSRCTDMDTTLSGLEGKIKVKLNELFLFYKGFFFIKFHINIILNINVKYKYTNNIKY